MVDPITIPTPNQRRPWRIWRRLKRLTLALLLLIVVALLIGFGEMKWTRHAGQKRLDAATAKLDAEDPGWRFEDIVAEHNSKVPPEGSNSALKAVEIAKGFPKFEPSRTVWLRKYELDTGRLPNELPDGDKWKELDIDYSAHEPGMIELRKWDAATPRGRFKIDYTGGYPFDIRFGDSQEVRNALTYLAWDSLRHAHAGRGDRSIASAMAGLHLVRSVDFEPLTILYLVRVGAANQALRAVEQTLAWCRTTSDSQLAAMQELVGREGVELSIRPALRGERAFILKGLEAADRDGVDAERVLESKHNSTGQRITFWYYRQFLPANSAEIIERFDELLTKLELPPEEKFKALNSLEPHSRDRENVFARLVFIPMSIVVKYEILNRGRCLCTAAGIACERYRLKHRRWPASLDDLAEFGIRKGLIDPFDGQPLRYATKDDGIIIYSIGTDGRDDGGDIVRWEGTPTDTGFRLWNEDKRRIKRVEPAD